MDFYQELLLAALISVLLALLISKIASASAGVGGSGLASRNQKTAPLTLRRGVVLRPIKEDEPEGDPSADGCGFGVDLAVSDRAESMAGAVQVEEQGSDERVYESDLEKENIEEKASAEVEVDVLVAEDSSTDKEAGFVRDEVPAEKSARDFAELGEEDAGAEEKGGSLLHGEDEWEGIERSELEKVFGVAAEFIGSEKGANAVLRLSNEVQLQLYGLHKVATEGPCFEPQPMALKVSARSKWHAWQRLRNMNPEDAMEQYISLVNDSIPGWVAEKSSDEVKGHDGNDPVAVVVSQIGQHVSSSSSHYKPETERFVGDSCSDEGATDSVATGPKLFKEGLTKLFLFNLLSPTRVAF